MYNDVWGKSIQYVGSKFDKATQTPKGTGLGNIKSVLWANGMNNRNSLLVPLLVDVWILNKVVMVIHNRRDSWLVKRSAIVKIWKYALYILLTTLQHHGKEASCQQRMESICDS